jgi:hypothetical protein
MILGDAASNARPGDVGRDDVGVAESELVLGAALTSGDFALAVGALLDEDDGYAPPARNGAESKEAGNSEGTLIDTSASFSLESTARFLLSSTLCGSTHTSQDLPVHSLYDRSLDL